jgi:hypothetical protein
LKKVTAGDQDAASREGGEKTRMMLLSLEPCAGALEIDVQQDPATGFCSVVLSLRTTPSGNGAPAVNVRFSMTPLETAELGDELVNALEKVNALERHARGEHCE